MDTKKSVLAGSYMFGVELADEKDLLVIGTKKKKAAAAADDAMAALADDKQPIKPYISKPASEHESS